MATDNNVGNRELAVLLYLFFFGNHSMMGAKVGDPFRYGAAAIVATIAAVTTATVLGVGMTKPYSNNRRT